MRRWGLVVALVAGLAAGALTTGAPATVAVAPTFTLVASPTCGSGETRVGRACVDRPTLDKWTIADGNASWDVPGQWLITYAWKIPATVPAAGAGMTMQMSAQERIGGPGNRICPAMGAVSGFGFKGEPAQPATIGFCAVAGGSANDSKTITLVPSSAAPAGSTLYLTVGLQDGPRFTYTYKAAPKQAVCKRRRAAAAAAAEDCTAAVAFIFTQGGRPKNAPTRVLDVRIVGQGAGTGFKKFDDEGNFTGDLEDDFTLKSARIVLERDYFSGDGGRGTQRLVFARPADSVIHENGVASTITTQLTLVASNDPVCGLRAGGHERKASLLISDRKTGGDVVGLAVRGCQHHQYLFKSATRVKVAISVK
jgi:hypothetical protein